ncbi:hypothetical protein CAC42_3397 [Sphaceloma murrayae]|uniref:Uncharacterized protein n=1 Tax=Sphaceloma murrayae TaxID=2082308 RepID=A0A2K1R1D3_9PEZI|nr:hypothetical protein CAC42_3397 [Sphaceloma murrayae]
MGLFDAEGWGADDWAWWWAEELGEEAEGSGSGSEEEWAVWEGAGCPQGGDTDAVAGSEEGVRWSDMLLGSRELGSKSKEHKDSTSRGTYSVQQTKVTPQYSDDDDAEDEREESHRPEARARQPRPNRHERAKEARRTCKSQSPSSYATGTRPPTGEPLSSRPSSRNREKTSTSGECCYHASLVRARDQGLIDAALLARIEADLPPCPCHNPHCSDPRTQRPLETMTRPSATSTSASTSQVHRPSPFLLVLRPPSNKRRSTIATPSPDLPALPEDRALPSSSSEPERRDRRIRVSPGRRPLDVDCLPDMATRAAREDD